VVRSGLSRFATRLGLALLGVALFCGYAVAPMLAFLPYVALVPWAILYTDPKQRRVGASWFLLVGYLSWIVCYKMTARFGWFVPPAMALFFTPAWVLFPLLARPIQRLSLPRVVTLPIVWVAVEWARILLATGHFDLFALGYSQARFPFLVQVADLTGVYGVSFLVAAVNGLLADGYFALRDAGWRLRPVLRERRIRVGALVVGSAFLAVSAYGAVRLATARHVDGPRLAVVQPNTAHTLRNFLGTSLTQLYQTDESVEAGSADLIVWPENAILDDFDRKAAYREDLAWLAARKGAWMLVGAQGRAEGLPGRTTNSAFLIDTEGSLRGRYDKQILFPWSEYIPLDPVIGAIAPPLQKAYRGLVRKAWGFLSTGTPGTRMTLFALPWNGGVLPFAALICVENTYPPLVSEAGRHGARFFVNITSEGEVGGVIQEQLLRVSILRAIENRIAYVRCGNSGISAFIDPQGRVQRLLRNARGGTTSTSGELTAPVALSSGGTTLYAASHDGFALLCVAASLFLLARAVLRGGPTMTPIPAPAATAAVIVLGVVLNGCGGPERAFARACPDEATCRASLAEAATSYRASGSPEGAVGYFDRVVGVYPSLAAEARPYRAYFLDRAGETRAAIAEYRTSLKEAPTARTYALLGSILSRIGDPAGALDAYREAQRLSPEDAHLSYLVARSLWEVGDTAEARAALAPVLTSADADPAAWTLLGKLELSDGHELEAVAAFERAAASGPDQLDARYQLSRLAWREGRKDDARRWLQEMRSVEATLGRGAAE
jgi:apolipoprotein N-acyltransferase